MNNRSAWSLILKHKFNLKDVAQELHDMGATRYDIGMSVMITDNHRADLIKHLEDIENGEQEVEQGRGR